MRRWAHDHLAPAPIRSSSSTRTRTRPSIDATPASTHCRCTTCSAPVGARQRPRWLAFGCASVGVVGGARLLPALLSCPRERDHRLESQHGSMFGHSVKPVRVACRSWLGVDLSIAGCPVGAVLLSDKLGERPNEENLPWRSPVKPRRHPSPRRDDSSRSSRSNSTPSTTDPCFDVWLNEVCCYHLAFQTALSNLGVR